MSAGFTTEEIEVKVVAGLRVAGLDETQVSEALTNFPTAFLERTPCLAENDSFFEFDRKVSAVVLRFAAAGLTRAAYVEAAVKKPPLFTQNPATLIGNITGVVERFKDADLTERDYVAAAVKQPPLFTQSPARLIGNITGVVERFKDADLTERDYVAAAVKQPSLFCQSPARLIGNITGVVERFKEAGLTERDYVAAAVKQPPLFCQSPARSIGNIAGVVGRFKEAGLTERDYVAAAVKQPQLFTRSPATIAGHIQDIYALRKQGIIGLGKKRSQERTPLDPLLGYLMKSPTLICLEEANYTLRAIAAAVLDERDPNSMRNLTCTRKHTESRLLKFYGVDNPKTPVPRLPEPPQGEPLTQAYVNNRAVRLLSRAGLLKSVSLAA